MSPLAQVVSIIVVSLALIAGMTIFIMLARLAHWLISTYAKGRDAFFEDLVLSALCDPEGVQRLRQIAGALYANWYPWGRSGLRPFDVWALERSLLRAAAELRGLDRQVLAGIFEDAGGIKRGLRQLRSFRWHRRLAAVHTLRMIGSRSGVPGLIKALADHNRVVRNAALRALGELRDERAYPFLLAALDDRTRWSTTWVADTILVVGPEIVPLMIARFTALSDRQTRTLYARLFGLLREPTVHDQLLPLLDAPELPLRLAAIDALGTIGDADAACRLQALLNDPHWEIRAAAVQALGALAAQDSIPMLSGLLGDSAYAVRRNAARTLIALGAEGEAALRAALDSDQPQAHTIVRQVLTENAYGLL